MVTALRFFALEKLNYDKILVIHVLRAIVRLFRFYPFFRYLQASTNVFSFS